MDINDVKKILDTFYSREKGPNVIKLLGGEPTQYSKFSEALTLVLAPKYNKYNKDILLISNLLFNKIILQNILDIDIGKKLIFLVNGMELDEKNRIKVLITY